MRFQYVSDLHLEVGQQYSSYQIPPCAPYLILAGDIGRIVPDYDGLSAFLAIQCQNFEKVLYVLGNHEFYGSTRAQSLAAAEKLRQDPRLLERLVIMNQTRLDINDSGETLTVLSCTLHSHITPQHADIVKAKIQDFRKIQSWTVDEHNAEHVNDLGWLKAQLKDVCDQERVTDTVDATDNSNLIGQKCKIIVVMHYAPIRKGSSRTEHEENPWTDAFATELLDPPGDPPREGMGTARDGDSENVLLAVDAWIFGHTHHTTSLRRGNVRVVSNQRGYVFPGQEKGSQEKGIQENGWKENGGQGEKRDVREPGQATTSKYSMLRRIMRSLGLSVRTGPRRRDTDIDSDEQADSAADAGGKLELEAEGEDVHEFDVRRCIEV
jgi:Calcineurin-like phosphoesterase